jgi:carbon storage regulator
MLVLSRKAGERIMVGENISVVISRISGNRVTIGIEAPSGVKIIRGELGPLETEEKNTRKESAVDERISDVRQWRSSLAPAVAK